MSKIVIGLFFTFIHIVLTMVMAYGVLFSKTPIQAFSVLMTLVVMFLGIRLTNGCCFTELENKEIPSLSTLGRSFLVKDITSVSVPQFEEMAVGICMLLQIIRTITVIIRPPEALF
jgi:hypothetical protein